MSKKNNNYSKLKLGSKCIDISATMNGTCIALEDNNSYGSLRKESIEICEFCDKIFTNRYSSIKHIGSHIIIPLQNQTVYQCMECLHHFTSQKALDLHKIVKHITMKEPQVVLIKEEPLDIYTDIEMNDSKVNNHYPKNNNDDPKMKNPDSKNKNSVKKFDDFGLIKDSDLKTDNSNSKIKNRLLFEEDLVGSDLLLTDFTNECKVNVELFPPPWFVDLNEEFRERCVGYDELMRPGVYRCKKCLKTFPNRYDTIIHEASHISLKKCQINLCNICDTYIIGGKNKLKLHRRNVHHESDGTKITNTCNQCGRKCNDVEYHRRNHCPFNKTPELKMKRQPNNGEHSENVCQRNGIQYKEYVKTLYLCDMCFSFCKNTQRLNYVLIGVRSEMGRRFPCSRCGVLFFEVKLVERIAKRRRTENDMRKKCSRSNEDRLKNIQQRLKMLKYLFVLFWCNTYKRQLDLTDINPVLEIGLFHTHIPIIHYTLIVSRY